MTEKQNGYIADTFDDDELTSSDLPDVTEHDPKRRIIKQDVSQLVYLKWCVQYTVWTLRYWLGTFGDVASHTSGHVFFARLKNQNKETSYFEIS